MSFVVWIHPLCQHVSIRLQGVEIRKTRIQKKGEPLHEAKRSDAGGLCLPARERGAPASPGAKRLFSAEFTAEWMNPGTAAPSEQNCDARFACFGGTVLGRVRQRVRGKAPTIVASGGERNVERPDGAF